MENYKALASAWEGRWRCESFAEMVKVCLITPVYPKSGVHESPTLLCERLVFFDPHVYKVHPAVTLSLAEGTPLMRCVLECSVLHVRRVLGQRLPDDEYTRHLKFDPSRYAREEQVLTTFITV